MNPNPMRAYIIQKALENGAMRHDSQISMSIHRDLIHGVKPNTSLRDKFAEIFEASRHDFSHTLDRREWDAVSKVSKYFQVDAQLLGGIRKIDKSVITCKRQMTDLIVEWGTSKFSAPRDQTNKDRRMISIIFQDFGDPEELYHIWS